MGKKQDVNAGAGAAALVVAVIVGLGTASFWGGVVAFVVLVGILSALKIVR